LSSLLSFLSLLVLLPPTSTPFPYTTLFRSAVASFSLSASHDQQIKIIRLCKSIIKFELHIVCFRHPRRNWIIRGHLCSCHFFSEDRKSTRLNSSHVSISYAVFCFKKKKTII